MDIQTVRLILVFLLQLLTAANNPNATQIQRNDALSISTRLLSFISTNQFDVGGGTGSIATTTYNGTTTVAVPSIGDATSTVNPAQDFADNTTLTTRTFIEDTHIVNFFTYGTGWSVQNSTVNGFAVSFDCNPHWYTATSTSPNQEPYIAFTAGVKYDCKLSVTDQDNNHGTKEFIFTP